MTSKDILVVDCRDVDGCDDVVGGVCCCCCCCGVGGGGCWCCLLLLMLLLCVCVAVGGGVVVALLLFLLVLLAAVVAVVVVALLFCIVFPFVHIVPKSLSLAYSHTVQFSIPSRTVQTRHFLCSERSAFVNSRRI